MKRIVLFVEGEGEANALHRLIKRQLNELRAWDSILLDEHPFRVGHVQKLVKDQFFEWKRKLAACLKRKDVGGVLLVLDGDAYKLGSERFCAASAAVSLAQAAVVAGSGHSFSTAVVFAVQEYETWLIAGIASLVDKRLSDGRLIAPAGTSAPHWDLEKRPRGAKEWLNGIVQGGYKPTRDQSELTELVDLKAIRDCQLRSFQRLEAALRELVGAIRSGKHVSTPVQKLTGLHGGRRVGETP